MPDSDADLAIIRLAWRIDALDTWRADTDKRVAANEHDLARLVKADEIADAVAKKMDELQGERLTEGNYILSRRQARAATLGLVVAIAALICDALAQAGVF